MAERVVRGCASCIHFHTEDPIVSGEMLVYRCSKSHSGRVPGWCPVGTLPKNMGCSCYNKLHPGDVIRCESMFDKSKYRVYLYCGAVEGNQKLLYDRKNKTYKAVSKGWLRTQTGIVRKGASIILHDESRKEWCRKQAKRYKEEWLKEHG